MMAIEAEFGSLFMSDREKVQEENRENAWFQIYESLN
jgi:hypothetical protein